MEDAKMLKTVLLGLLFSLNAQAIPVDFNEGFCVKAGEKAVIENAVLLIKQDRIRDLMNNQIYFAYKDHNFFDFTHGDVQLQVYNWAGAHHLTKLAQPISTIKNTALYSTVKHSSNAKQEFIAVECEVAPITDFY